MKIMFISDIHGIKTNCGIIKMRYNELGCEKLVVLGDLFYQGPKNSNINNHDSLYVAEFLNTFSNNIICMKGNCDSEADESLVNFPIIPDLSILNVDGINIYLTHGNKYNMENLGKISGNAVLMYGHYHIPFIKKQEDILFINAGSISLPKENYKPTYVVYSDREFCIYDIEGNITERIKI